MGLNYPFHALKCPLNLKFYDSNETIALQENKRHTWPGNKKLLESTAGFPVTLQNTLQDREAGYFRPRD